MGAGLNLNVMSSGYAHQWYIQGHRMTERNMHDLSRQKLVQGIYRAIARQNEKCMTFQNKSLQVVGSFWTKFLSTSSACNPSNKLLITESGKCGRKKKKKRTTMTVERRWTRNSNAMARSIFLRRRSSNSSIAWGAYEFYKSLAWIRSRRKKGRTEP